MHPHKNAVITSIGTAIPKYKQLQKETAELIAHNLNLNSDEKRLLKSIYRATGIEKRHSVLSDYNPSTDNPNFFPTNDQDAFPSTAERMAVYKKHAFDLALSAINNCLSQLDNFDLNKITHLITVSCTGMYAPGIDIELIQHLKLNSTTKRTAINFMGCYGAFNALKVADAICRAESDASVLIVCVELCTIHFQKNMSLDNMISNSIFADGAASVLMQSNPIQDKHFVLQGFYSDLLPQTKKEMAWAIGDSGFDIILSSYVPDIIKSGISAFTHHLLNEFNLTLSDIDFFAIHPGGIKILQSCETALDITKDQNKYARQILRDYGNMSSATVLFVLKAIWDDINTQSHQKNIFSCAFGPGLTLESMILKTHIPG